MTVEQTAFNADKLNAYTGRLGHVDAHYRDPQHGLKEGDEPADEPAEESEEESAEEESVEEEEPEAESDEEADLEEFTVAELKAELDALGVEYDPKLRKAELIALVQEAEAEQG